MAVPSLSATIYAFPQVLGPSLTPLPMAHLALPPPAFNCLSLACPLTQDSASPLLKTPYGGRGRPGPWRGQRTLS